MRLFDSFDGLLLDLDGTVWAGSTPIPHAPQAITAASATGLPVAFITNNASRSNGVVAKRLHAIGIPTPATHVISSPQVAVELLRQRHRAGERVLVLGSPYLRALCAEAGFEVVDSADDHPVAVVQGHNPDTGWAELTEATLAIRAGADYVATNRDLTLPADRGLTVGNGSMVAAVVAATGVEPANAGKPAPAMLHVAAERLGAQRPLVVGDRLDTDIAAGANAGMATLAVLTGVSQPADIILAPPTLRPTFIADDLRGLFADPAAVTPAGPRGGFQATVAGEEVIVTGEGPNRLDALLTAAAAVWASPGQVTRIRATDEIDRWWR